MHHACWESLPPPPPDRVSLSIADSANADGAAVAPTAMNLLQLYVLTHFGTCTTECPTPLSLHMHMMYCTPTNGVNVEQRVQVQYNAQELDGADTVCPVRQTAMKGCTIKYANRKPCAAGTLA